MNHPDFVTNARQDSIIAIGDSTNLTGSSLTITGENSSFHCGRSCLLKSAKFSIESAHSSIIIDDNVKFIGKITLKGDAPNRVHIRKRTTVNGATIVCSEGTAVEVGEDCMLSWGIEIRTTDSHGIFDMDTGERINRARDIQIGNHVWISAKATLLKGTRIKDGCILGMGSMTSSAYDVENAVLVGTPAKVVRERVRWERPTIG